MTAVSLLRRGSILSTLILSDGRLDNGDVTFQNVTTITDQNGNPFPELSLDPEGIAFTDRGTIFISSEGERAARLTNPFVNEFSLQGRQFNELPIPTRFNPAGIGANDPGVRNNLAFESLAISPNQRYLFTATENALVQDGPAATLTNGTQSRILQYDLQTGQEVGEFLYITDAVAAAPNPSGSFNTNGLVELLALDNNGTFLSLERSFSNGVGNTIKLYETSILGATDIRGIDSLNGVDVDAAAQKRLLLNFDDLGITLDNLEGIALGPQLADGRQSLIVVSDNNFSSTQFTQVLSFALDLNTIPGAPPIVGDDGNNSLFGDNGNDTIQGRGGNDLIFGGEGVNTLFGDGGDDIIYGGSQADSITGGTGNDLIFAGEGNNTIFGGAGDDIIYSGSGSDRIDGGKGNDTIWLGGGRDVVVLAKGEGVDTINNFQLGQTQIGLSGGLTFNDLAIAQGNGAALISAGDELLASLSWVQASSINASNFVTV